MATVLRRVSTGGLDVAECVLVGSKALIKILLAQIGSLYPRLLGQQESAGLG